MQTYKVFQTYRSSKKPFHLCPYQSTYLQEPSIACHLLHRRELVLNEGCWEASDDVKENISSVLDSTKGTL